MSGPDQGLIIKAGVVIALLALLSPPSWATDDGDYTNHEHKFEQKVEAEGYCTIYQNVDVESLEIKNSIHGSGIMDAATLISSNQTKTKYYPQDKNTLVYLTPIYGYESNLSFIEENDMSYAPMAVAYGTGYYARNPIVYDSKPKERTEAKSRREGVSTNHQIEYASAFQKYITVDLWWKDAINFTDPPVSGFGGVRVEVEEVVTEGAIHLGELVTDPEDGWKRPLVEIDENYVGDIKLTRKMEVSTIESPEEPGRDWLSCCCLGGYGEMECEKIWDEEEVFEGRSRDVGS